MLKSKDYQLGTPIYEDELETDGNYFDQIPSVICFNGRKYRLKSKELTRKQTYDENDEFQNIVIKMIAINDEMSP